MLKQNLIKISNSLFDKKTNEQMKSYVLKTISK